MVGTRTSSSRPYPILLEKKYHWQKNLQKKCSRIENLLVMKSVKKRGKFSFSKFFGSSYNSRALTGRPCGQPDATCTHFRTYYRYTHYFT